MSQVTLKDTESYGEKPDNCGRFDESTDCSFLKIPYLLSDVPVSPSQHSLSPNTFSIAIIDFHLYLIIILYYACFNPC